MKRSEIDKAITGYPAKRLHQVSLVMLLWFFICGNVNAYDFSVELPIKIASDVSGSSTYGSFIYLLIGTASGYLISLVVTKTKLKKLQNSNERLKQQVAGSSGLIQPERNVTINDDQVVIEELEKTVSAKIKPKKPFRYRVLVAIDEVDQRNKLQALLSDKYHLHYTREGREGIKELELLRLRGLLPDAVIEKRSTKADSGEQLSEYLSLNEPYRDVLYLPFDDESQPDWETQHWIKSGGKFDFPVLADAHYQEQAWLNELETKVIDLAAKSEYTATSLASAMHVSRSSLHRKIKNLTGLPTNQYAREVRLQYARQCWEQQTISEVPALARATGFSKTTYFRQLYLEHFGIELPN